MLFLKKFGLIPLFGLTFTKFTFEVALHIQYNYNRMR